jgi:rRNA-processing protein FCF1
MKIILDTNFLIDCLRFNIDIKAELAGNELFVSKSILFEIEKITERGTKESSLAKKALDFIKESNINVLESENNVDESLLSYSRQGYAIATHDRALKARLKKAEAKIIYVRQKKYLVVE